MSKIKIINLDIEHLADAVALAKSVIPSDGVYSADDIEPSFRLSLGLEDAESFKYLNVKRILQYVIALGQGDEVIGVSGIYSINSGYFSELKADFDIETTRILEDGKNFWIGWTGVNEKMQGQGVGTELLRAVVAKASDILHKEELADGNLMVVADKNATGFYQKCGMHKIIEKNEVIIYSAAISNLKNSPCNKIVTKS